MAKKKTLEVPVLNKAGETVSTLTLDKDIFDVKVNQQVVKDAVVVYQANLRQATAKTKKRDEVSGGGKKPWRQKGTGRARAGSTRSPIWVGGGIVWGPTGEQNYTLKQNKKEHRLALLSALTLKAQEGLVVVDDLNLEATKTKEFIKVLGNVKAGKKTLIVLDEPSENLVLSSNNVAGALIVPTNNVSVYDLLHADTLLFTVDSLKKLEEVLK